MIAGERVQPNDWVDAYYVTYVEESGKVYERRESEYGTIGYWHDKALSRDDKPARYWHDGTIEWFRAGRRHREDGPAVEYADGSCQWYIDGKFISGTIIRTYFEDIGAPTEEELVIFKLTAHGILL